MLLKRVGAVPLPRQPFLLRGSAPCLHWEPPHPTPLLPLFQGLMHSSGPVGRHRQLTLVLEGELYLIPFALLKGSSSNEYLFERFSLLAVPSVQALSPSPKVRPSGASMALG